MDDSLPKEHLVDFLPEDEMQKNFQIQYIFGTKLEFSIRKLCNPSFERFLSLVCALRFLELLLMSQEVSHGLNDDQELYSTYSKEQKFESNKLVQSDEHLNQKSNLSKLFYWSSELEEHKKKQIHKKEVTIQFLRKMINAESDSEVSERSYQTPSTFASSLANNLTKNSTNLFESISSKGSFLKSLFTSSLASSTTSINSIIKSNSSNNLISQTVNMANATTAATLLPNYINLSESNENSASYRLMSNHLKKLEKKRNKKIDATSKIRSKSSSGLEDEISSKDLNELISDERDIKLTTPKRWLKVKQLSLDHDLLSDEQLNDVIEKESPVSECTNEDGKRKSKKSSSTSVMNSTSNDQKNTKRNSKVSDAENVGKYIGMKSLLIDNEQLNREVESRVERLNDDHIELIKSKHQIERSKIPVLNSRLIENNSLKKSNQEVSADLVDQHNNRSLSCSVESNKINKINKINLDKAVDRQFDLSAIEESREVERKKANFLKNRTAGIVELRKERNLNKSKSANDLDDSFSKSDLLTKNDSLNRNNSLIINDPLSVDDSLGSLGVFKKCSSISHPINLVSHVDRNECKNKNLKSKNFKSKSTNQLLLLNSKSESTGVLNKSTKSIDKLIDKSVNSSGIESDKQSVEEITIKLNQQQQHQLNPNKASGTLDRLKKLAKGFNSSSSFTTSLTKKDRIRESLNSQSTNCIEQLLLHEHCKTTTKCRSASMRVSSTFRDEIKMKFRRSDPDYNLTKSMRSVDHKDLTLMQILALKKVRSKLRQSILDKTSPDSVISVTAGQHHHTTNQSYRLINNPLANKKQIVSSQRIGKLIHKMVLPESSDLSSSPVCTENAPINCFDQTLHQQSTNVIYSKKDLNSNLFTSKFITNDASFADDENISKNNQNIYKQKYNNHQQLDLKRPQSQFLEEANQCDLISTNQPNINEITPSIKANQPNITKKWIQLAGHEQSFFFNSTKPGIILKKNEQNESSAYKKLNDTNDQIVEFIPRFYSILKTEDGQFIELQDLLTLFDNQCNIMDIKMGCRTFLENDVSNIRARPDLYEKLVKIDSSAATQDEHRLKAITKLRYMTFRENLSSSSTLGFRIEGFRCKCNGMIKDFKYLRKEDDVKKVLKIFLPLNKDLRIQLLKRLKLLKSRFKESDFFKNHEVVGSSLLIIYDDTKIGVWMIDFGRTVELPKGIKINHETKWDYGNHEDGYLTGLNNLIRILKEIV